MRGSAAGISHGMVGFSWGGLAVVCAIDVSSLASFAGAVVRQPSRCCEAEHLNYEGFGCWHHPCGRRWPEGFEYASASRQILVAAA